MCAFKDEESTEWLEYLLGRREFRLKDSSDMVGDTVSSVHFTCLY